MNLFKDTCIISKSNISLEDLKIGIIQLYLHIRSLIKVKRYTTYFHSLINLFFISEAQAVAKTYDCKFIETSTVLNHNVDELLVGILSQIRLKIKQNEKSHSRLEQIQGCVNKSKQILHKIFSKKEGTTKSCENLYVL